MENRTILINKRFRSSIVSLLLATMLFGVNGCAVTHKFGPYLGRVVDAETGEPIEGAVVFMECSTISGTFGGTVTHYVDAKEVMTDSKGEFYIELRVNTFRSLNLWDRPVFLIFKPGYEKFPGKGSTVDITIPDAPAFFPDNKYVTIRLPKLTTKQERLKNLDGTGVWFEIPYNKRKNLFRLTNEERIANGLEPSSIPYN